ncbi:MAG: hypothetical protein Q7S56_00220 [Nanoarchaeota archaeon]|nr:hypothetical protein [Nanoarchaeota archaeon]
MKIRESRKIGMGIFAVLALVLTLSYVAALQGQLQQSCLSQGGLIRFSQCNPAMSDYVCSSTSCQICVTYYPELDVYCPAHPSSCNNAGLQCNENSGGNGGGGSGPDLTAPAITIHSPIKNQIYSNKRVLLNVALNEIAKIEYSTNGGTWKEICRNGCMNGQADLRLEDGSNLVEVRAIDKSQNINQTGVNFFIDSKKPRILKTMPKKGYANGSFSVEFREENPVDLKLIVNGVEHPVNLNNCIEERKGTLCETNVDLFSYDGQEIPYYFVLEDMAGNVVQSKETFIKIDVTDPIVNVLNYTMDKTRVSFMFNITENNFDEISFIDDNDRNPRETRLCSRLKDGICETKRSFREGLHHLTIYVKDDAGNSIEEEVSFEIIR